MASDSTSFSHIQIWPQCPHCATLCSTRCPFCNTAGNQFSWADDFSRLLDLPTGGQVGPCCGPGGCTSHGNGQLDLTQIDPPPAAPVWVPLAMVLCPTCDEPFEPEFARRCESCGHEFPDGFEVPSPPASEFLNPRILACIAVIAVAIIAGIVYFFALFRKM